MTGRAGSGQNCGQGRAAWRQDPRGTEEFQKEDFYYMIDRFTEKARAAIELAAEAAEELGHGYVGTEHLLLGLLQEGTGVAARVLEECGVREEKVMDLVSQLISPGQTARVAEPNTYTPSARRVIENSYREAVRFKASLIGTEHLLIAMIRESDCVATRLLNTMGISIQRLYVDLLAAMGEDAPSGHEEFGGRQAAQSGARGRTSTPTLDSYSRDLTALAREGKLDPVIGRRQEIQRVVQILSRRTKNNPCLIGAPGRGRTGPDDRRGRRAGDHFREARTDAGSVGHGGRVQIPRRV